MGRGTRVKVETPTTEEDGVAEVGEAPEAEGVLFDRLDGGVDGFTRSVRDGVVEVAEDVGQVEAGLLSCAPRQGPRRKDPSDHPGWPPRWQTDSRERATSHRCRYAGEPNPRVAPSPGRRRVSGCRELPPRRCAESWPLQHVHVLQDVDRQSLEQPCEARPRLGHGTRTCLTPCSSQRTRGMRA